MERVAIISVDGHVKAPRAGYRDYIDPKWRDAFDDWVQALRGHARRVRPRRLRVRRSGTRSAASPTSRRQGVVAEVLFANGAPFAAGRVDYAPDPEQTRQANMAFNRWVIDFCSEAPGRLHGQALVSFDDVDQAVKDVHWAKEQGLVGILMPPLYPGSKFFFDPALDPIWAACQEVGLPLSQHGGTGAPNYQPQVFAAFMVLAAEHSFFSGPLAVAAHPRRRVRPLPGSEDRLHRDRVVVDRADDGPARRPRASRSTTGPSSRESMRQAKPYTRLPSEYWRTNCYAGHLAVPPVAAGVR